MIPEFLVISHRLPVKVENNTLMPTDGGLASALRSAHLEDKAHWVGCLGESPSKKFIQELPSYCSHVSMDQNTYRGFYNGYSNSVLWPSFHSRLDLTQFKEQQWSAYFEANRRFSETVIDSTLSRLPLWVHDYQLMLVPLLVKLHQPRRHISFFLHIPWPELKIAKQIPRLSEIIRSLSKCDSICVHTQEYAVNMQEYFNYVNENKNSAQTDLPISVLPIGISPEDFETQKSDKASPFVWNGVETTWKERNIVGVDRLDYSKGLDKKIEVFSEFLELNPTWRTKVTLRQLLIPSREDVKAYQIHRSEVLNLVEYTNNKYGTKDWKPIDLFYGRTSSENLKKIYCNGDVCWINSRKDGMNLVALEYIAAQCSYEPGLLMLSDQAGCSQHLSGALSFDGSSDVSAFRALSQALKMSEAEKRVRYKRDIEWIKNHSVSSWVEKNLELLLLHKKSHKQATYELREQNKPVSLSR